MYRFSIQNIVSVLKFQHLPALLTNNNMVDDSPLAFNFAIRLPAIFPQDISIAKFWDFWNIWVFKPKFYLNENK